MQQQPQDAPNVCLSTPSNTKVHGDRSGCWAARYPTAFTGEESNHGERNAELIAHRLLQPFLSEARGSNEPTTSRVSEIPIAPDDGEDDIMLEFNRRLFATLFSHDQGQRLLICHSVNSGHGSK